MELRDLVELLYTAHVRFTTIHVSWEYRYNIDGINAAQGRWVKMNPPGSVAMLTSRSSKKAVTEREQVNRVQRRVWWQKPTCWREEYLTDERVSSGTILCDGKWWTFSSEPNTLYTNVKPEKTWPHLHVFQRQDTNPPDPRDRMDGIPLLDPSFLLMSHALQPVGETIHAGREAVQVRAAYRKNKNRIHEAFFWTTADEYDLLVDKASGILLRYAALFEGQEYAVSSVQQVIIDEPIPENVFSFSPPG